MRRLPLPLTLLAVILALAGSASAVKLRPFARHGAPARKASTTTGSVCAAKWVQIPTAGGEPTGTHFTGFSFDSPSDGWAVADSGITERWNGSGWTLVPSDSSVIGASFESVAAISPTDAWAVGAHHVQGGENSTLIEHWDGSSWTQVSSPNPSNSFGDSLLSVSAVPGGGDDVWAVGAVDGGDVTVDGVNQAQPLILHHTSSGWDTVDSAVEPSGWQGALRRVLAISAGEVWATGAQNLGGSAGDQPFSEEWNGSQWSSWGTSDPGFTLNQMYGLTADAPNDVLAVGIYNRDSTQDRYPLEEQWDGSRWNTIHFATTSGSQTFLVDAASGGPNSTWAVGQSGPTGGTPSTLIARWTGSGWSSVASPNPNSSGFDVLDSVGVAPGGYAFAAGRDAAGPFFLRQCPAAAITIAPVSGEPGTPATISGTGFGVGETVNLTFDGQSLGTAGADSTGTFTAPVTIPASAALGSHTVTAQGATTNKSATATFTVTVSWAQFRRISSHTADNPFETAITASTANRLGGAWTSSGVGPTDASPAVANGVVYIGSNTGALFALATSDGHALWHSAGGTAAEASPAVAGGRVYVGTDDGHLEAFRANGCTSGACSPVWTATIGSGTPSSPAVAGSTVFIGGSDGELYAFDAAGKTNCTTSSPITCSPLWTAQTSGGALTNTPAVDQGRVFVHARNGQLLAYDAAGVTGCSGSPKTCAPIWTNSASLHPSFSSPAVSGGLVFFGTGNGRLYAVRESNGSTVWIGATPTNQRLQSSPALSGPNVYIGSIDHHLYAYTASGCGSSKCSPTWSFDAGDAVDSSPAAAADVVYAVANSGQLFALNASNGSQLASVRCPSAAAPFVQVSSPAILGGTVYEPDPIAGEVCAYQLH